MAPHEPGQRKLTAHGTDFFTAMLMLWGEKELLAVLTVFLSVLDESDRWPYKETLFSSSVVFDFLGEKMTFRELLCAHATRKADLHPMNSVEWLFTLRGLAMLGVVFDSRLLALVMTDNFVLLECMRVVPPCHSDAKNFFPECVTLAWRLVRGDIGWQRYARECLRFWMMMMTTTTTTTTTPAAPVP